MWGYRFGYTAAQIELAIADAPFVNYKSVKKDKKNKADRFRSADALDVLKAQAKWEDRKSQGKKRFSSQMFEKQQ